MRIQPRAARGFTLIELLIVVIILAILAAIVIPQFSNSTRDAQEATMDANLASMRSAVELYKVQHNGVYPGTAAATGGTACTGTTATAASTALSSQAFIDQLIAASDATGVTCNVADTKYRFGPYLRQAVPNDPISNKGTVAAEIVTTNLGTPLTAAAATGGYAYDFKSGQIIVNSNATDVKGKAYSTH